eukprot:UN06651
MVIAELKILLDQGLIGRTLRFIIKSNCCREYLILGFMALEFIIDHSLFYLKQFGVYFRLEEEEIVLFFMWFSPQTLFYQNWYPCTYCLSIIC